MPSTVYVCCISTHFRQPHELTRPVFVVHQVARGVFRHQGPLQPWQGQVSDFGVHLQPVQRVCLRWIGEKLIFYGLFVSHHVFIVMKFWLCGIDIKEGLETHLTPPTLGFMTENWSTDALLSFLFSARTVVSSTLRGSAYSVWTSTWTSSPLRFRPSWPRRNRAPSLPSHDTEQEDCNLRQMCRAKRKTLLS